MNKIFYRIYKIGDNSCGYKNGYYRFKFNIGNRDDDKCEFSVDKYHWEDCDLFKTLSEFEKNLEPLKEIKYEHLDYVETVTYHGYSLNIFDDDYGQCYFTFLDGQEIAFGGWQTDIEEDIKLLIDDRLETGNH